MEELVTLFRSVQGEAVYLIQLVENGETLTLSEDEALNLKALLCAELGPQVVRRAEIHS